MINKITIFLGAFLAFLIQPMVGRILLPLFGGAPSIWISCLCMFQALIVVGYGYAMYCVGCRGKNGLLSQVRVTRFCILLICVVMFSCVVFSHRGWLVEHLPFNQVGLVIVILSMAGLPYLFLSANSTVVQVVAGCDYGLYVFSNIGSIIGLVAYPVVFEPFVDLNYQWATFVIGTIIYALLLIHLNQNGMRNSSYGQIKTIAKVNNEQHIGKDDLVCRIAWFLIPFTSCFLLNAVTAHITIDVLPMPFVWVFLLSAYFLSYVIAFTGRYTSRWQGFVAFSTLCILGASIIDVVGIKEVGFVIALFVYCSLLFFICVSLNMYLYDSRPLGNLLPRYYLVQAVGGALGGVFSGLVLPNWSSHIIEYPIAIGISAFLLIMLLLFRHKMTWALGVGIILNLLISFVLCFVVLNSDGRVVLYMRRSVFGLVKVYELKAQVSGVNCSVREFYDGNIFHGVQVVGDSKLKKTAYAYYGINASGAAIVNHYKYRQGLPMRVNITGLGIGTLLTYSREQDHYVAYEISADVLHIATNANYFSYVSNSKAGVDIKLSDARIGLSAEKKGCRPKYDVIVLDAFSGENLPYHLMTEEAIALYLDRLNHDGMLCLNISNWYLDLKPYVKALARRFGLYVSAWKNEHCTSVLEIPTEIAILSREPIAHLELEGVEYVDFSEVKEGKIPSDCRGSFIGSVRWLPKYQADFLNTK